MNRGRRLGTVAAMLALSACGSGASPSAQAPEPPVDQAEAADSTAVAGIRVVEDGDGGLPVTVVDATGTEVTVDSTERIIAANGDLTEVVFALGLGDRVVARDISATYPPEAAALPSVGYQRALPTEAIAALGPSVVVASTLAGPPETIDGLRAVGIPVVVLDYDDDTDGPADKVRGVGAVLGVPDVGVELGEQIDAEMADAIAVASRASSRPRVAALYLRGESVQLLFGPGSGASVLLDAAGAVDVGAELGVTDSAPITAEALLRAAPDVLVVTDSGLESVGGVEGLLGIAGGALGRTPAGESGRILAYDDQYLLGFGPRTGQVLAELVADLHPELEEPS